MTSNQATAQNKNNIKAENYLETTKANIDKSAEQGAQFADASREGANKIVDLTERAAENTKQIVQRGVETTSNQARETADRINRTLGYTGEGSERLAQQSKQNMEAVVRCGTVLTQAFQDTSRIWLDLSQKQWQRNLDGLNKLARAKSVQEFSAIQSELVRDGLQSMVQDGKAIADTSARAIEEASKTFSDIAQQGSASAR